MTGPRTCPTCRGDGQLQVRGEAVNPANGIRGWDPQHDHDIRCPRCHGAGHVVTR